MITSSEAAILPISIEASLQHLPQEQINGQWVDLTGAVLSQMSDPAVRASLMQFSSTSVSETLPERMLQALPPGNEPISAQTESASTLAEYLAIPMIPDERLVPDLRNASPQAANPLARPTITDAEYELVADRYTKARDVKLLALGAEILEYGMPAPDERGIVTLPSGTKLFVDPELGPDSLGILDPTKWQGRKQMQDRVHKIWVGNQSYVLKEQKTGRHRNPVPPGSREETKLSSAQEFAVAREFAANSPVERDGYELSWERPIGYVEYPDGFQFTLFGFEEGLMDDETATKTLRETILANSEAYDAEYKEIAAACGKYKDSKGVQMAYEWEVPRSLTGKAARAIMQLTGAAPKPLKTRELTFEDFARAKARQVVQMGIKAHKAELKSRDYLDPDTDGIFYRVDSEKIRLEVIGFDFERYTKPDDESRDIVEAEDVRKAVLMHRAFLSGYSEISRNAMEVAAFLALIEKYDPKIAELALRRPNNLQTV